MFMHFGLSRNILRSVTLTSVDVFARESIQLAFGAQAEDHTHCPVLDTYLGCALDLQKSLVASSLKIQRSIGSEWEQQAVDLLALLDRYSPNNWIVLRDALLEQDDMCKALLKNVEGHRRTGLLAGQGLTMAKLLRQANGERVDPHAAPAICKHSTLKDLQQKSEDGIRCSRHVGLIQVNPPRGYQL